MGSPENYHTNECSLDTIIPIEDAIRSGFDGEENQSQQRCGRGRGRANGCRNPFLCKHIQEQGKTEDKNWEPSSKSTQKTDVETGRIECTEDFFDKTLRMSLIDEVQEADNISVHTKDQECPDISRFSRKATFGCFVSARRLPTRQRKSNISKIEFQTRCFKGHR